MKKPKEGDVVKACLGYARMVGVFAWRNNTGRMPWTDKTGNRRSFAFGSKGSPDIIGIMGPDTGEAGRFLAVECKVPGGKQSPDQIAWQAACEAHGGLYILATSLDELIEGLRA